MNLNTYSVLYCGKSDIDSKMSKQINVISEERVNFLIYRNSSGDIFLSNTDQELSSNSETINSISSGVNEMNSISNENVNNNIEVNSNTSAFIFTDTSEAESNLFDPRTNANETVADVE